jgi:transaldolase/glucose-6-phosphate isomerase
VLLTADPPEEVPIPRTPYGFGTLQQAQWAGDYRALVERGRRVLPVHLRGAVEPAMRHLDVALRSALAHDRTPVS